MVSVALLSSAGAVDCRHVVVMLNVDALTTSTPISGYWKQLVNGSSSKLRSHASRDSETVSLAAFQLTIFCMMLTGVLESDVDDDAR